MYRTNAKLGHTYCESNHDGGLVFVEEFGRFHNRRYFTNERRALAAREIHLERNK